MWSMRCGHHWSNVSTLVNIIVVNVQVSAQYREDLEDVNMNLGRHGYVGMLYVVVQQQHMTELGPRTQRTMPHFLHSPGMDG